MNIVLWVVQVVLAAAFLAAGVMKLVQDRSLLKARMAWVEDVNAVGVKAIGALEVLGAAGLLLSGVFHFAPVLTTLAALGLALTMLGALIVHLRRNESAQAFAPVILLVFAVFVLWGRAGPYPLLHR